jgi:hypothetical protein
MEKAAIRLQFQWASDPAPAGEIVTAGRARL